MNSVIKTFKSKLLSINEKDRTVQVVVSDESEDRHGEVVKQDGWDFTDYQANPVVFWGHNSHDYPVGLAIDLEVQKDLATPRTVATIKFAENDADADKVWNLVKQGIVRTTSVGFINLLSDGAALLRNKLLEISWVGIPANPNAVTLALKSGRMNKEDADFMRKTYERELALLTKDDEVSDNVSGEDTVDNSQPKPETDSEAEAPAEAEAEEPKAEVDEPTGESEDAADSEATDESTDDASNQQEDVADTDDDDSTATDDGEEEISDEEAAELIQALDDKLNELA